VEIAGLLAFAADTARGAGAILKENYGKGRKVSFKGEIDLVTEVDTASEAYIKGRIRERFPDHGILAEESPEERSSSPYRWIVDPLDGTTNYAHAYPCFCVSVAVEREGRVVAGAVYQPLLDEMFAASLGGGATLNGSPISVSAQADLRRSLLVTGFAYDVRSASDTNLERFGAFVLTAQAVRRDGSAALDLCYTACGRFDGFWEMKLKAWDTAAGALILSEAGGTLSDLGGGEYSIFRPELVASNGKIHGAMLGVLAGAGKTGTDRG
jgi:myo-inositol-1(or 4)-monophosphatase